jgi:hypothetical protein
MSRWLNKLDCPAASYLHYIVGDSHRCLCEFCRLPIALKRKLASRYLAPPCSFLPVACRALSCRKLSRFKTSLLFATPRLLASPPPRLPPNSNFLHPRSQFHSSLSLSLLSDLSLFVPSAQLDGPSRPTFFVWSLQRRSVYYFVSITRK